MPKHLVLLKMMIIMKKFKYLHKNHFFISFLSGSCIEEDLFITDKELVKTFFLLKKNKKIEVNISCECEFIVYNASNPINIRKELPPFLKDFLSQCFNIEECQYKLITLNYQLKKIKGKWLERTKEDRERVEKEREEAFKELQYQSNFENWLRAKGYTNEQVLYYSDNETLHKLYKKTIL